jgi:vacuolar protein sorting-associated protein 13A/C
MHSDGGIAIRVESHERLDLNLSVTFVEMAISVSTAWSNEGSRILRKARGGDAPYQIRNLTGVPINVWSDADTLTRSKHTPVVKLLEDQMTDWRFEDWRTMREVRQY